MKGKFYFLLFSNEERYIRELFSNYKDKVRSGTIITGVERGETDILKKKYTLKQIEVLEHDESDKSL